MRIVLNFIVLCLGSFLLGFFLRDFMADDLQFDRITFQQLSTNCHISNEEEKKFIELISLSETNERILLSKAQSISALDCYVYIIRKAELINEGVEKIVLDEIEIASMKDSRVSSSYIQKYLNEND